MATGGTILSPEEKRTVPLAVAASSAPRQGRPAWLPPLLPHVNRNAAAAEGASMGIEAAGEWGLAATAAALWVEAVVEDLIPVADDERLAAGGAGGGVAIDVVDVADIDVLQTGPQRDVACAAQGGVRGGWHIGHAVVGMEG